MMADIKPPATSETTSAIPVFLRIFWMILGNVALGILALVILQNRGAFFSIADPLYWVTVPLLIVARYVDIARYKGTTGVGEPATMRHWRKYALTTVLVWVAVWLAAHGIAYALAG